MDLQSFILRSQTEKTKYHMIWLICGILKNTCIQMNLYTKQKTGSQTEQTVMATKGRSGGIN